MTNFYEFKRKKKKKARWKKYDDRYKNKILLELMEEYIDTPTDKINIFIESKQFSPDFDPFDEYFKGLKPWKKSQGDFIGELCKTVDTEDPKKFAETLERFFVGCIDCLLKTDSVNDVCLVFQSPQGIGKSRWMRSLLPKAFQSEYLYEGNIDTRNKDHNMYLSQYWFIHLDELESLKSNEIGAVKSYITRQRISVRQAYGRYKSNFVRRVSFLGSVNEDKFLSDITGNRRWLVFKASDIDYQHKINPDDIWRQAYTMWKSGYRHWFDISEIKDINQRNEEFRNISLDEELLMRYFKFRSTNKAGKWLTTSEVVELVISNVPALNNKLSSIKTGKALSKHCKGKRMKSGSQCYWVDYIGPDNSSEPQPFTPIKEKDDLPF